MSLKSRAQQLKADIPALFLVLNSPDTPALARILAALTVAYALSPIDLIPDFLPVLGYLDDALLLPAMAALTIRLIPRPVMDACRRQAAAVAKRETQALVLCTAKRGHMGANCMDDSETMF